MPKGCANPPKNAPKLSECCPGYPSFFNGSIFKNCESQCKTTNPGANKTVMMCCVSDCLMNTIGVLTNGKFDTVKATSVLTAQLSGNIAWTSAVIKSVVDTCATKGEILKF